MYTFLSKFLAVLALSLSSLMLSTVAHANLIFNVSQGYGDLSDPAGTFFNFSFTVTTNDSCSVLCDPSSIISVSNATLHYGYTSNNPLDPSPVKDFLAYSVTPADVVNGLFFASLGFGTYPSGASFNDDTTMFSHINYGYDFITNTDLYADASRFSTTGFYLDSTYISALAPFGIQPLAAVTCIDCDSLLDTGTVPEPASLALLGIGLVGMGVSRKRKNKTWG